MEMYVDPSIRALRAYTGHQARTREPGRTTEHSSLET